MKQYERRKKWLTIATTVMNSLFLAPNAISGSLSSDESYIGTYAYLESQRIPSLLRKEALLDGFLC